MLTLYDMCAVRCHCLRFGWGAGLAFGEILKLYIFFFIQSCIKVDIYTCSSQSRYLCLSSNHNSFFSIPPRIIQVFRIYAQYQWSGFLKYISVHEQYGCFEIWKPMLHLQNWTSLFCLKNETRHLGIRNFRPIVSRAALFQMSHIHQVASWCLFLLFIYRACVEMSVFWAGSLVLLNKPCIALYCIVAGKG